MAKKDLPLTEELDFHYLLTLMLPLQEEPEYAALPELFSIIGYDKLIELCQYAGGECIKIPTLSQLCESIEALQYFYDVYIKHCKGFSDIPLNLRHRVGKIHHVYTTSNS